jgi:hypothetical protein
MEFHEPTGLQWKFEPKPIRYSCGICNLEFDTPDQLLRHRFEAHPNRRPMLLVRGQALGATPHRIARAVTSDDFLVNYATAARVNNELVPIAELGERLARYANDRVTIELANDSVPALFEIDFKIAHPVDLDGVESCFDSMVQMKRLDIRAIEDFIAKARPHSTAMPYMDGICSFLYGVLAKERAPDCAIAFDAYREKFELAIGALRDFDRPLALIIRGLVSFHFNQFEDAMRVTLPGPLHVAAERFYQLLASGRAISQSATHKPASYLERALTDFDTQRIVKWTLADTDAFQLEQENMEDLEDLLGADLVEYDRTKLRIILAEEFLARGHSLRAGNIARTMRNNSTTEVWAESVLARVAAENIK